MIRIIQSLLKSPKTMCSHKLFKSLTSLTQSPEIKYTLKSIICTLKKGVNGPLARYVFKNIIAQNFSQKIKKKSLR